MGLIFTETLIGTSKRSENYSRSHRHSGMSSRLAIVSVICNLIDATHENQKDIRDSSKVHARFSDLPDLPMSHISAYLGHDYTKYTLIMDHVRSVVDNFDEGIIEPLREFACLDSLEETLYKMWLFNREVLKDLAFPVLRLSKSIDAKYDESMQRLRRLFTDDFHRYWAYFSTHLRDQLADVCSVGSAVNFLPNAGDSRSRLTLSVVVCRLTTASLPRNSRPESEREI